MIALAIAVGISVGATAVLEVMPGVGLDQEHELHGTFYVAKTQREKIRTNHGLTRLKT